MKKTKNLFVRILACVLVFTMAFAFTACKDESDGDAVPPPAGDAGTTDDGSKTRAKRTGSTPRITRRKRTKKATRSAQYVKMQTETLSATFAALTHT